MTINSGSQKPLIIREVGPDKLEEVIKMDLECNLEIMRLNRKRPSKFERFVRTHRNNFLAAYKEPVEQKILGAWVSNTLVGFIWVRIEPEAEEMVPVGFIESVFVRREFRGKGVGKALIKSVEQFCKERGVSWIELVVNVKNANAIRFYRRMGFKTRRYTLEKKLTPAS